MIKNFNKKRIFSTLLIGATLMVSILTSTNVNADTKGGHIHMSPVRTILELKPGETYSGTFKVMSTGTEDFTYKLYANPYQIIDENGGDSYDTKSKYTQITDWITFDKKSDIISSNEIHDVTYTIKVPENAPSGGQYAIIFAETANPQEPGSFTNTNSRVGQILYVSIDGDTNECVKITSNDINTVMFEPPITAKSLVENCGNVHQEASYVMKVYPLFSDQEIYTTEENPETHMILPETRRYNTLAWTKEDGAPMMGIFNVEQTVKIGKETSTVKKLVFIFPLWLVIIFILLVAAIVFKLVSNSRSRKEAKRSSVNTPAKSDSSEKSE